MKLSTAIILASIASTSAFTLPLPKSAVAPLRMSDTTADSETTPAVDETPKEVAQPKIIMSQALPFQQAPALLDGSMVGDFGFDPLGLAKSKEDLINYREAEIKHARLAMLAAAGWPVSELLDKKIALALGMKPILDATDRAPSVLNGGLGKISPAYWIACLVAAAAIDGFGIYKSKNDPNYFPGNLGFDPLGLYPKDAEGQRQMQLKELKNGRLAMMAIFGFAMQEFFGKLGVVDETPVFFKPLGSVLQEYANSGYYVPN